MPVLNDKGHKLVFERVKQYKDKNPELYKEFVHYYFHMNKVDGTILNIIKLFYSIAENIGNHIQVNRAIVSMYSGLKCINIAKKLGINIEDIYEDVTKDEKNT